MMEDMTLLLTFVSIMAACKEENSKRNITEHGSVSCRIVQRMTDCSKQNLTAIPKFSNLTEIILANNDLQEIKDDTFNKNPNLKILNVSHNQLSVLNSRSFSGLKTWKN